MDDRKYGRAAFAGSEVDDELSERAREDTSPNARPLRHRRERLGHLLDESKRVRDGINEERAMARPLSL